MLAADKLRKRSIYIECQTQALAVHMEVAATV